MHFHMTPSGTKADCFLLFFCYTNEFLLKKFLFLQIVEIDTRSSFFFAVSFTICCLIMLAQKAALGYQPKKAETSAESLLLLGNEFFFQFYRGVQHGLSFLAVFAIARQSLFLVSQLFHLHTCIFSVQQMQQCIQQVSSGLSFFVNFCVTNLWFCTSLSHLKPLPVKRVVEVRCRFLADAMLHNQTNQYWIKRATN